MKGEKTMAEREENGVSYVVKKFEFGKHKSPGIVLMEYNGDPVSFQIGVYKPRFEWYRDWLYFMKLKDCTTRLRILEPEKYALSLINDLEEAKKEAYQTWMNWFR